MTKKAQRKRKGKRERSGAEARLDADSRSSGEGSNAATERVELTDEEADMMVTQALDCELPEPEPLVKILVFLYDLHEQGRGPELSDSLHRLMTAAYNNSNAHSANFNDYLQTVRREWGRQ